MRHLVRLALAASLGLCAALLVACGGPSNGYLAGNDASSLNTRLAAISAAISSGKCRQAEAAAAQFGQDVANLPSTVSSTLRANLIQGANTIAQLTPQTCAAQSTPTTTTTTATTTTQTQTTAPATTQTQTTPTQTAPQQTVSTATATTTTPQTTTGSGGAGIGNSGNTGNTGQSSGGAGTGGSGGGGGGGGGNNG